jgi:hypothetical protein
MTRDLPSRRAAGNRRIAAVATGIVAAAAIAHANAARTLWALPVAHDGALLGRVCAHASEPPRAIVDDVGAPVAIEVAGTLWLDAREAMSAFSLAGPDCNGAVSLRIVDASRQSIDDADVEMGLNITAHVRRALEARSAGHVLEARRLLVLAAAANRPRETARWARLHLARVHLELGEGAEAEGAFRLAEASAAAPNPGLDAFAALIDARLSAARGEWAQSIGARAALAERLRGLQGTESEDYLANEVYRAAAESFVADLDTAIARLRAVRPAIDRLPAADPMRVSATIVAAQLARLDGRNGDAEAEIVDALRRLASEGELLLAHAQLATELGALRLNDRPLEGLAAMRPAVAWYVRNLGESSQWTLDAEVVLAGLQSHAGHVDEAIATQRRVVAAYAGRAGDRDLRSILAVHSLANFLLNARRWREGAEALQPAIARADALGDAALAERTHMRIDHALALWDLEGAPSACRVVAEARELSRRTELNPSLQYDLRTLEAACLVPKDAVAGLALLAALRDERIAHFGSASRSAIFGRAALARQLMNTGQVSAAVDELSRMSATLESLRQQDLPEAGGGRAMFADWLESDALYAGYRDLAWLYVLQKRDADAVRVAEATRARSVNDVLGLARRIESLDDTMRARAIALASRIRTIEAETALLPVGALERAARDDERATLDRMLASVLESARSPAPRDVAALARRIPRGTAYVGIQITQDGAWAYVARSDQPLKVVPLTALPSALRLVPAVLAILSRPLVAPTRLWRLDSGDYAEGLSAPERTASPLSLDDALGILSRALVKPLERHLSGIRRLAIAPDGALTVFPIGVLASRYETETAPSLATWIALSERPARARELDLVIFEPPDYAQLAPAPPTASPLGMPAAWPSLPGARDEAREIAALYAERRSMTIPGTKSTILSGETRQVLESARYVHVSAHAYLAADEPSWSSLVVAGQDGRLAYLTAAELSTMTVNSDLVVLSACETGRGRTVVGEGLFGLPHAIIVAGARAALLTLWSVEDAGTAEFMKRLHAKLARGERPAKALAATKREFMRHPRWSAPFYWAPFVLYGAG